MNDVAREYKVSNCFTTYQRMGSFKETGIGRKLEKYF